MHCSGWMRQEDEALLCYDGNERTKSGTVLLGQILSAVFYGRMDKTPSNTCMLAFSRSIEKKSIFFTVLTYGMYVYHHTYTYKLHEKSTSTRKEIN